MQRTSTMKLYFIGNNYHQLIKLQVERKAGLGLPQVIRARGHAVPNRHRVASASPARAGARLKPGDPSGFRRSGAITLRHGRRVPSDRANSSRPAFGRIDEKIVIRKRVSQQVMTHATAGMIRGQDQTEHPARESFPITLPSRIRCAQAASVFRRCRRVDC